MLLCCFLPFFLFLGPEHLEWSKMETRVFWAWLRSLSSFPPAKPLGFGVERGRGRAAPVIVPAVIWWLWDGDPRNYCYDERDVGMAANVLKA